MRLLDRLFRRPTPRRRHRIRYGARVDKVVVGHTLQRLDEVLSAHPDKREAIDKVVCTMMLERHLGLSDLRYSELAVVLKALRRG